MLSLYSTDWCIELSARVHPERVRAGDDVTLECGTSCYRPPGTVWFKDGRPVANLTFQAQPGDSGNYSCAIEGQESDPSDPVALDVQCECCTTVSGG